ncbi:MAG: hypothetical protein NZ828_11875 [Alphaproteobacteria bacterium]|nr:hypothetical protein [Alphaproteobacteria bacterium]
MQVKRTELSGLDSPSFVWLPYLLLDDRLFFAKDAKIYFNMYKGKVYDVVVAFFPSDYLTQKGYSDHPVYSANASVFNKEELSCSSGNCFSDWMKTVRDDCSDGFPSIGNSPYEDFRTFEEMGFLDNTERARALKEFSRIKECDWAREFCSKMEE